jgi:hypothetical protein
LAERHGVNKILCVEAAMAADDDPIKLREFAIGGALKTATR